MARKIKKGFKRHQAGYYLVHVGRDHPLANGKGYAALHQLVTVAAGRPLLPGEVVHHRNGNPADNRIANLQVIPKSTHHAIHAARQPRGQRGRFGNGR